MKPTKRESRTVALVAIVILAAVSAMAEEKYRRTGNPNLKTDTAPVRRIVVSLQDCKLALLEGDRVLKIWNTAVGAESTPSPSGTYTIMNRLSRPTYYHPGKMIPPGSSNPLGTRWLGLSLKGFGIHGTNVPGSIGRKASHGCIRMRNRDIEELFDLVQVGGIVELHSESNESLAQIFNPGVRQAPSPDLPVSMAASFVAH
jgi:lipoprotein-anchoring transpeptidase ErfK/SrfK